MRLIDADKLPRYNGFSSSAFKIAHAVENAPTVDAVPVVRCKDCIYSHMTIDGQFCKYCDILSESGVEDAVYLDADYFCADGEREAVSE